MLSFLPKNFQDIMEEFRTKFKERCKVMGYTQTECATRSGVSLGLLKCFESSGQISFESLLKLAFVLECLGDFTKMCESKEVMPKSIEEIVDEKN